MTAVAAVLSPLALGLAVPALMGDARAQDQRVTRPVGLQTFARTGPAPSPRGAKLWVDPSNPGARAVSRTTLSKPAEATLLRRISTRPQAMWLGEWIPATQIRSYVAQRATKAAAAGAVPVFVVYGVPMRDCGGYSAGGLNTPAKYRAWIDEIAGGIGARRAIVVVEPDGLASLDCLPSAQQYLRTALVSYAVDRIGSGARTSVYLDAGNARWQPSSVMASRLKAAGVRHARGFALNVSNFDTTSSEIAYGKRVSNALGGAVPFVVDTSRNGLGPFNGGMEWCNPPGRALGAPPTTSHPEPLVDALLWVKVPGESDGLCRGGPSGGTWWQSYAVGLASRAR